MLGMSLPLLVGILPNGAAAFFSSSNQVTSNTSLETNQANHSGAISGKVVRASNGKTAEAGQSVETNFNLLNEGATITGKAINEVNRDKSTGYYSEQKYLETATPITVELEKSINLGDVTSYRAIIRGKVEDIKTGNPIEGARVYIYYRNRWHSTFSAEDGTYELKFDAEIRAKSGYKVRAHKYCDLYEEPDCHYDSGEPVTLDLQNGQVYEGVDFAINRNTRIKGVVKTLDGSTYLSSTIRAYLVDPTGETLIRGYSSSYQLDCDVNNCEDGYILNLDPGRWLIEAEPVNPAYQPTFYSEGDNGEPTIIQAELNQEPITIDFSIGHGGTIEGTVRDKFDQSPIPNAPLSLRMKEEKRTIIYNQRGKPRDNFREQAIEFKTTTSDANGNYKFTSLPKGEYYIYLDFSPRELSSKGDVAITESKYPSQFWGGSLYIDEARSIILGQDEAAQADINIAPESTLQLKLVDLETHNPIDISYSIDLFDKHGNVRRGPFSGHSDDIITIDGLLATSYYPLISFDQPNSDYTLGYTSFNNSHPTLQESVTLGEGVTDTLTVKDYLGG